MSRTKSVSDACGGERGQADDQGHGGRTGLPRPGDQAFGTDRRLLSRDPPDSGGVFVVHGDRFALPRARVEHCERSVLLSNGPPFLEKSLETSILVYQLRKRRRERRTCRQCSGKSDSHGVSNATGTRHDVSIPRPSPTARRSSRSWMLAPRRLNALSGNGLCRWAVAVGRCPSPGPGPAGAAGRGWTTTARPTFSSKARSLQLSA